MPLIWKYFVLAFSALLPVVNPLGSALVFLGLVGVRPAGEYRALARSIAFNTILFFAAVELVGSAALSFFGISLPIVQVSGGLVLAAMGWSMLNEKDEPSDAPRPSSPRDADQGTFYPLTFPVTAGPGCIVVMLTLSAHASRKVFSDDVLTHVGLFLAAAALCALVYLAYAYAPKIARVIPPSTAHGVLRVVAFLLLCIGVQIAWNGADALITGLVHRLR
ncbi:MAG: NAAT family transporter [Elusimicrobia bacterium]|nr:NAAT family transporter [Elusimicrobiota bacterium]